MTNSELAGRGSWLRRNWMRLYFAAGVLLATFGAGLLAALYEAPPFTVLKDARSAIRDYRQNAAHYSRIEPTKHLFPARTQTRGVVQHDAANSAPGATLVAGLFGDSLGFRLLDEAGDVLHAWNVSFNEIWPNPQHIQAPHHDWDISMHGVQLFPNGDIVFNFEYEGLVRIDRESRVVWKAARNTHHALYEDEEGALWAPDRREHLVARAEFPGMKAPFYEDLLVRFDASGAVLEEISVLKVIYESRLEGLLFLGGHTPGNANQDWLHVNDVEVLPSALASAFPQFAPGDIMVSARNMNLVFVVDRATHRIKWWRIGPWLRQHDPDFSPDGRILVFDNRMESSATERFGASRIVAIDPQTYAHEVLFEGAEPDDFYTRIMGKLQLLENGNLLLTESVAGRAVEVTPQGRVVWEFVNRWDDARVARINDAIRYDRSELTFLSDRAS